MWYRNYSTSSTSQLQVHFENPHLPLAFDWSPSPYCIHNFSKPWEPSSISGRWEIFSRTKLIAFCISKRWGMVIRELGLNCRAAGLRSNLFYLSSLLKGSWWQRNTVYKIIISNGNRTEWSTIRASDFKWTRLIWNFKHNYPWIVWREVLLPINCVNNKMWNFLSQRLKKDSKNLSKTSE